ncbi:Trichohyalin [Caenorhabditis elegans]|uniref:Trichohyalin n=1 Tax=Caenorhabditis elegans TaxID=6239 RepID=Q3V5H3_CAEEL|nr:Trichohyalin [Caenorhabditis elegans]CCD66462.1 Trichohyalin [Caenorhabditis elegans]|eukprot:NP_494214.2 Uncharacterized protein CELE_Y59C2A.3 [Caenorhabditis elegans]
MTSLVFNDKMMAEEGMMVPQAEQKPSILFDTNYEVVTQDHLVEFDYVYAPGEGEADANPENLFSNVFPSELPINLTGQDDKSTMTAKERRAAADRAKWQRMSEEQRTALNEQRKRRRHSKCDSEQMKEANAKKAEAARARYHQMSEEEKFAYNRRKYESRKQRKTEERPLIDIESLMPMLESKPDVATQEFSYAPEQREADASISSDQNGDGSNMTAKEKRAAADRARYLRMSEEDRSALNQRRREKHSVDVNLEAVREKNAKKAEAARIRYHQMSDEEKIAYNRRKYDKFRKRRETEEKLLMDNDASMSMFESNPDVATQVFSYAPEKGEADASISFKDGQLYQNGDGSNMTAAADKARCQRMLEEERKALSENLEAAREKVKEAKAKRAEAARIRYHQMSDEEKVAYNRRKYETQKRRDEGFFMANDSSMFMFESKPDISTQEFSYTFAPERGEAGASSEDLFDNTVFPSELPINLTGQDDRSSMTAKEKRAAADRARYQRMSEEERNARNERCRSSRNYGSEKMKEANAKKAEAAKIRYHQMSDEEKTAHNRRKYESRKQQREEYDKLLGVDEHASTPMFEDTPQEEEFDYDDEYAPEEEEVDAASASPEDLLNTIFPSDAQHGQDDRRIVTVKERRAAAARDRYHKMSEEEKRLHNQRRRYKKYGFDPKSREINLEDVREQMKDANAKKAEAARVRYHQMSDEERLAHNQKRAETLRKRREEDEKLLTANDAAVRLAKAQQIAIQNARKAEAARLRYQKLTPEERKALNRRKAEARRS